MVFELSALRTPNLNEKTPQFVIADTKDDFDRQSKNRLRYLTAGSPAKPPRPPPSLTPGSTPYRRAAHLQGMGRHECMRWVAPRCGRGRMRDMLARLVVGASLSW